MMKQLEIQGFAPEILQYAETAFSVNGVYDKVRLSLNRTGDYNLLVPFNVTEASVKRNPSYKVALADVTSKMLQSFDSAVKTYTEIYKEIESIIPEEEYKERLDKLVPKKYVKRVFDVSKPKMEEAEQLIQEERKSRAICGLAMDEKKNSSELLKLMEEKWNELHEYFNEVEALNEEKRNQIYLSQYQLEKAQLEGYLYGEESFVLNSVEGIFTSIEFTEDFQVQYDYNKESGILCMEVKFPADHLLYLPFETASLYSTGKLSVKSKTKKDLEQEHSLFYSGLGLYLSSLCFNISSKIQRIRFSITRPDEGLYWVEFNRNNFANLKADSLNPIIEIQSVPNVLKLNAAGNLVGIPMSKFNTLIQNLQGYLVGPAVQKI